MIIKQFLLLRIASYGNQTILSTRSVAAEYRSRRRTAPETICRSRDMVGAHETLSGSCDLSTTLSVMVKVIDATSIEGFMVLRTMHMRRRNYSDDTL